MHDREPPAGVTRRWVNAVLGLGVVSTLTGLLGSVLTSLWPTAARAAGDLVTGNDGPLMAEDLAAGDSAVGRSRLGKVLVVRDGDRLVGLQATCTHLGCTVAWNAASGEVECPCHGARYNLRGDVLGGPAREPLAPVLLTIEEAGIRVSPAPES